MDWRKSATEEEKAFLHQLTSAATKAEKQYRMTCTSFYVKDWMEHVILKYLGHSFYEELTFEGGYLDAERQVAVCGRNDYNLTDQAVTILKVEVKTGIGKALAHRDFLGALMGLGIEREKIGDIVLVEQCAYLIVVPELADFIALHLTEVGRYGKVNIAFIEASEMQISERAMKEITGTVASLRADAVFALGFGLSRAQTAKLLQQERGKVNGIIVHSADVLKAGDQCTLRGHGKMKFIDINGTTKKERIHIKIEKYI